MEDKMKKQINDLLLKMQNGENCIGETANRLLDLFVSGSALLPDGWKVYKCTDCQEVSVKKDNREITVGSCDSCGHPLWNDDVN
jgi:hypothetical protein